MRLARASGTATALLLAIALAAASGCDRGVAPPSGGKDGGADGTPAAGEPPPAAGNLPFEEITEEAGIRFRHFNGFTGKRYIVEIVGSGGGFLDYDLDGDLDLYLVNGSLLPGTPTPAEIPTNRLYRNDGSGRFEDVTGGAGVADRGYGMGLAAGDIDNDGDPDLYVTNYGPNALYRNRGDGTFEEIAAEAGVSDPGFSSAAVFFDHDNDGDLDLYVSGYLIFDPADFTPCRRGRLEVYCSPDAYDPVPGRLYQNDGSGRFEDVSEATGISAHAGKGLGAVAGDFDGDGDQDLYVANDGFPNFLFINRLDEGVAAFREEALFYGAAFGEGAKAEAGMGVDLGDFDEDGDLDVVVTNLEAQTNSLYRNDGGVATIESSFSVGLGAATLPYVGFGIRYIDHDLDGDLDLIVTNGHIIDNIEEIRQGASTFAQPDQLFENEGGRFREVLASRDGPPWLPLRVGRGLAGADIDDDGDVDLLITNNRQEPFLLRNVAPKKGVALGLRLEGAPPASNRDAYGARVTVKAGGRRLLREVRAQYSYLATHDPRLLVALPRGSGSAQVTIRWPGGRVESLELPPGAYHHVREGEGVLESRPFRR